MFIVLLDGRDPRFLGGSARARNARVVSRSGASLCDGPLLSSHGRLPAMLVPPDVALTTRFFDDPNVDAAARRDEATRLIVDDAFVVIGPASTLASHAAAPGSFDTLPTVTLANDSLWSLATRRARRAATRAALLATAKPTDGWVSRHWNRPLSRACSRAALALGLNANTASLVTLGVGLLGAWVAAQPPYGAFVLTGVLFQLASVLDGVDGEIARATLTESAWGARIDTVVDQLTYAACFIGTTIGWVRAGSGRLALVSTVVIGLALALTLARGARFVEQHGDNASFVIIDRSVRRAARETGHGPLRLAAWAFTLLRRDSFAVLFLLVSLTGLRVAVPALILAGVAIANVTLTAYAPELASAARAERRPRTSTTT